MLEQTRTSRGLLMVGKPDPDLRTWCAGQAWGSSSHEDKEERTSHKQMWLPQRRTFSRRHWFSAALESFCSKRWNIKTNGEKECCWWWLRFIWIISYFVQTDPVSVLHDHVCVTFDQQRQKNVIKHVFVIFFLVIKYIFFT